MVGVMMRVYEIPDGVADPIRPGDLVDCPLEVVADRWRRVEQDDPVGRRQERRLVDPVPAAQSSVCSLPCASVGEIDAGRAWSQLTSRKPVVVDPSNVWTMLEKVSYSARSSGALGRDSAASLVGRHREREVLERLLQSAASGESGVG